MSSDGRHAHYSDDDDGGGDDDYDDEHRLVSALLVHQLSG